MLIRDDDDDSADSNAAARRGFKMNWSQGDIADVSRTTMIRRQQAPW